MIVFEQLCCGFLSLSYKDGIHCLHPSNLNLDCDSCKVPVWGAQRSRFLKNCPFISLPSLLSPLLFSFPLHSNFLFDCRFHFYLRNLGGQRIEWNRASPLAREPDVNTENLSSWQAPRCSLTAFKHLKHILGILSNPLCAVLGMDWHTPGIPSDSFLALECWMTCSHQHSWNTKQLRAFAKATASEGKFWDVAQKQSSCRKKKEFEKILRISLKLRSRILSWDFPKKMYNTKCLNVSEGCNGSKAPNSLSSGTF